MVKIAGRLPPARHTSYNLIMKKQLNQIIKHIIYYAVYGFPSSPLRSVAVSDGKKFFYSYTIGTR